MMLEKIKELCNSKGLSVNKLEQELGFSQGSIGKMGESMPKADRLYKVAEYFGVPMEYFFNEDEIVDRIQSDLKDYLKERPVYRTAAGEGAHNDIYTADSITMGEEGYEYATVIGDSMMPELRDGDAIKILPTAQTTPRDYTLIFKTPTQASKGIANTINTLEIPCQIGDKSANEKALED